MQAKNKLLTEYDFLVYDGKPLEGVASVSYPARLDYPSNQKNPVLPRRKPFI